MADVPITLSAEAKASGRGAALLALAGLDSSLASPPLAPSTGVTVAPDPERHGIYRAALERHRRLYETVVGPGVS